MDLIETHKHELVFKIDKDAPEEYINKWNDFKLKCESGENEYIVEQIKEYCKLEQNKSLPYLKRCEGGLGGDNNLTNKQIRFRKYRMSKYQQDNDIIFDEIINVEQDKWTYEELDDLIYAFQKVADNNLDAYCVNGYIKITNYDGYEDPDSDV